MKEPIIKYLIVFFALMLITQPLILLKAPVGSSIYMIVFGILIGGLFSIAVFSLLSFRKISRNLEGNIKEITKRFFISNVVFIVYLMISVTNNLHLNKIITLDGLLYQVMGVTGFCLVMLYFFILFDVVSHMKKQPKIYDSKSKTTIFEDDQGD